MSKDRHLPTGEPKSKFRQRLMSEGRWQAFVTRREALKKSEGMTGAQAWDAASREFAPADGGKQVAREPFELVESAKWPKDGVPEDQSIEWVFQNLARDDVKPDDAPSAGSWGLLVACKRDPERAWQFYTSLWTKMLSRPKSGEDARKKEDERKDAELLDLIDRVREGNRKAEALKQPTGDTNV